MGWIQLITWSIPWEVQGHSKKRTGWQPGTLGQRPKKVVFSGSYILEAFVPRIPTSPHLRSRREVGDILRSSGVPVIEFRTSIVIGSGSLSFELIRSLVERLPVMITPRWVSVHAQPIAVNDLLEYLIQALHLPGDGNSILEIGGRDVVSYGGLMQEYARQRGLKRIMIPVPVLTPGLSSLWLGLVTLVFARIGRKLIDSVRHSSVVQDTSAKEVFNIVPVGVCDAISDALKNEDLDFTQSRWSDALSSAGRGRQWGESDSAPA